MTLNEVRAGASYTIIACNATGRTRARLDSLGLVVGEKVSLRASSFAGIILEIKGSRLALSAAVAATLEVA